MRGGLQCRYRDLILQLHVAGTDHGTQPTTYLCVSISLLQSPPLKKSIFILTILHSFPLNAPEQNIEFRADKRKQVSCLAPAAIKIFSALGRERSIGIVVLFAWLPPMNDHSMRTHQCKFNPSNAKATFLQSIRMQRSLKTIATLSCWYSLDSSHWVQT